MSKRTQNEVAIESPITQEVVTEIVNPPVVEPETKKYPIAIDGSQAASFITDSGSVSSAIRKLTNDGFSRGEVAKMLNKRYQHVRNVLITPLKKNV